MAKVQLDVLFNDLSGHIGNMVYYSVRGKTYARQYVIPDNPRSELQTSHRNLFAEAMAEWKKLGTDEKLVYKKRSRRLAMHGHNLFVSEYIKSHRNQYLLKGKPFKPVQISAGHNKLTGIIQPCTDTEATLYMSCISFNTPGL